MKQRTTYFVPPGNALDPKDISVKSDAVDFRPSDPPAIEKRVTVGLSELPKELRAVFDDIHELHVRWSAKSNYDAQSPLLSRLPPGLHAFFTPRRTEYEVDVCPLLKAAFGNIKCHSTVESFSRPSVVSERFSHSSAYQFYSPLPKILPFQAFLARRVCNPADGSCVQEVAALAYSNYIDLDYDALSHAITMTVFWRPDIQSEAARTPARRVRDEDSLEVGVLHQEQADEPEELKFGGYLTVVGDDEKPAPTLFSFASRHHPLNSSAPAAFTFSLQQPTGLHPKLDITFPSAKQLTPPKEKACALHAYFTLPSAVFIDRYQLSDPPFLASQNLVALHSLSGEQDLEAPDWVVKRWGSAALVELALPDAASRDKSDSWTATIPSHLRYVQPPPNSTASEVSLEIPWPAVFWACEAQDGLKMSTNPFDRVNLGYDGLFGPKTMFYHIPPAVEQGELLLEKVTIPVLEPSNSQWIKTGTLLAVALGFAWVCWKLVKPVGKASPAGKSKQKAKPPKRY